MSTPATTSRHFLDDLGRTWSFERQAGGGLFVSVADDDVIATTTLDGEAFTAITEAPVRCPVCLNVYTGPEAAERAMECAAVYQDA